MINANAIERDATMHRLMSPQERGPSEPNFLPEQGLHGDSHVKIKMRMIPPSGHSETLNSAMREFYTETPMTMRSSRVRL